jgi:hypothetical protein
MTIFQNKLALFPWSREVYNLISVKIPSETPRYSDLRFLYHCQKGSPNAYSKPPLILMPGVWKLTKLFIGSNA